MQDYFNIPIKRIAKIPEIAELASVSTATVDRVLNDRKNVSASTRQRVLQAKAAIENGETPVPRSKPWRMKVFLPEDAGPSTAYLASCFQEVGAMGNATIECVFTRKMEPAVLARKLRNCIGQGIEAVAFQALDDPRVHDAVVELENYQIHTLALLSGIESKSVVGYVGIDNRAAGRTAGYLMGRMASGPGPIAILSGGQLYRSHEEREMGCRAILRREFPHNDVLATYSGNDDIDGNYEETLALLSRHPEIVGIYNVGGGNEGVVRALNESGHVSDIMLIGHNLTPKTQSYLLDGSMDAVIHQNMSRAAQKSVDALIASLNNKPIQPDILPVEIITKENIWGATFG
ncbi:LacI family DNA-binding transcriptional regulator [Pseudovibrio sp. Tun.PSC04-5.I4]|uniref:LacI family DNA-binding transcriptional regulator n=1 Tax=Pseudovibrio sp. Tun.PSC04-5.I4 TaxID=1798213 RepID=UPI00135672CE|nr:LacI family DNA-binding transcriptional regulator [Pseudovibrio sp. Tun.PSC04-5.I4]